VTAGESARPGGGPWPRVSLLIVAIAAVLFSGLAGAVWALDPYGARASASRPATPIMDINQRYMYPQIVRSGQFDSAVFGTSTVRLLDPVRLGDLLGGRLANLGLNAGTPWEQTQLADLFLRKVPAPRVLVFGVDQTWCDPEADTPEKRLTPRPFPPWLYDDSPWNDIEGAVSLQSLEIAGRVAMHRLGFAKERIRRDGYDVFLPPDASYDVGRARFHLWGDRERRPVPVAAAADSGIPAPAMPALAWLDGLLARTPATTSTFLLLPPLHAGSLPHPDSPAFAREAACKARLAALASKHGVSLVDFRLSSDVTLADENYWDPLHYRVGIARRMEDALRAVRDGVSDGGWWRRT
jgi:hypothetical protein